MEGAEQLVIFDLERSGSFEVPTESDHRRRLDDLLGHAHGLELFVLVVSGRQTRLPARAVAVVAMCAVGVHLLRMVRCAVVEG